MIENIEKIYTKCELVTSESAAMSPMHEWSNRIFVSHAAVTRKMEIKAEGCSCFGGASMFKYIQT
jgi:hypothetical protein